MGLVAMALGWWADRRQAVSTIKVRDQAIGILLTNRIDQFRHGR